MRMRKSTIAFARDCNTKKFKEHMREVECSVLDSAFGYEKTADLVGQKVEIEGFTVIMVGKESMDVPRQKLMGAIDLEYGHG